MAVFHYDKTWKRAPPNKARGLHKLLRQFPAMCQLRDLASSWPISLGFQVGISTFEGCVLIRKKCTDTYNVMWVCVALPNVASYGVESTSKSACDVMGMWALTNSMVHLLSGQTNGVSWKILCLVSMPCVMRFKKIENHRSGAYDFLVYGCVRQDHTWVLKSPTGNIFDSAPGSQPTPVVS